MRYVQSPIVPFVGAVIPSHASGTHCVEFKDPARQRVLPSAVYPPSHCGSHTWPLCSVDEQFPEWPLEGGDDASQGAGLHVTSVSWPCRHVSGPFAVYPASHVGWQADPLDREAGQSPTEPCSGAAGTSHESARQTAALSVPRPVSYTHLTLPTILLV